MYRNRIFLTYLLVLFIGAVLFLSSFESRAQLFNRKLLHAEKELSLEFKMPKGFVAVDTGKAFLCGDKKVATLKVFTIMSADSSIKIAFGFTYPVAAKNLATLKKYSPSYDDNKNYLLVAKNLADTAHHKLIFYDRNYSRKKFNAQNSGEYIRACTIPYEGIYNNHKVVFFQKDNMGHVEITYFFKDCALPKIDLIVKETAGMIKYKEHLPATKW